MTEPTTSPVLETGATHRPRAARARRVSPFWLAYAAGQEEAVAVVAALAARDGDDGDGHGDGHAGDDGDAYDAMPMDAWLALSDAEQAAIVAAYLAPSGAARAPAPQRGAFDPARAQALLSAMRSGASMTFAARALGIGRTTIRNWMAERPDFAAQVDALQAARQAARRRGKRRNAASR
jgi:hypothetical protein